MKADSYMVRVKGEAEMPFRGGKPDDIDALVKNPGKNTKALIFLAAKAQVEMCLQKGDVQGAWEAIETYANSEFEFNNPLNCFGKDKQHGDRPYIGGYQIVGALRESAHWLFDCFYGKKGDGKPAKRHFRKFIQVKPHHIFMRRNGGFVEEVDGIIGQQPTEAVKGFARYEYIDPVFKFDFDVHVNPVGPLANTLASQDNVVDMIQQAARQGLMRGRGIGCGGWVAKDIKVLT
jgi:hypothetical protein